MGKVNTVDTRQFNAMCGQLSQLSAVRYEEVVRSEVGRVLEAALNFTPALKVAKVRARYDAAIISAQPATMYEPQSRSGKVHRAKVKLTKNGYVKYFLGNRYPAALWSAMSANRRARLARIIGARGLAKQSWLRIAQMLGITLGKVPGYVAGAVASTGRQYSDVNATETKSEKAIRILIENSQPTVNKPEVGGERALRRAIAGRIKFFEKNAEKAVFADVGRIAKAYPGMKVVAR